MKFRASIASANNTMMNRNTARTAITIYLGNCQLIGHRRVLGCRGSKAEKLDVTTSNVNNGQIKWRTNMHNNV